MAKTYIQEKLIGVEGQVVSFDYNNKAIVKTLDSTLGAVLIVTCDVSEITVSDLSGSMLIRNSSQLFVPVDADYYITSDGDTLYTSPGNKFTVYLPRIGEWTVSAFINGLNVTKTIYVDGAGTFYVDLSSFNARIEVSYPTGSTCICTDGDLTLTADNQDGSFIFNIPRAGTWNVVAYTAVSSASSSVDIQVNGQYVNLDLSFVYTSLDENTWETISAISSYGEASSYWSIGDTKSIVLNGSMGTLSLSNFAINVFIIGFDHNSALESDGSSTITFAIGKSSTGIMTAFIDEEYPSSDPGDSYFTYARSSSYAPQGYYYWLGSKIRLEYLGQDKTNPRGLLSALPSSLRDVIKPVRKTSFNSREENATITSVNETLFLLSLYEIIGETDWEPTNNLVESTQKQYEYFKNNSPVAYRHNDVSNSAVYWTRSVHVSDGGSITYYYVIRTGYNYNDFWGTGTDSTATFYYQDTSYKHDRALFAAFNV